MEDLLALIRTAEEQDSSKKFEKYLLLAIGLILLALAGLMMFNVQHLQGTARVVNYAGIMRGGTQRLVKLEMHGFTNQVLEERLDEIILALRDGSERLSIVPLDDETYQKTLNDTITSWDILRKKIAEHRLHPADWQELLYISEDHFVLADQAVSQAEAYSQRLASRIQKIEYGINCCFVILAVMLLRQLMHIMYVIGRNRDFREKDTVSNLYKKDYFYEHADNILNGDSQQPYTVLCTYVEHFNLLNEKYSGQKCNAMLRELADMLHRYIPDCALDGRLSEDTFSFLVKKQPDDAWLGKLQKTVEKDFCYPVSIKYGVYDQNAKGLSIAKMCDRIRMSVDNIKNKYGSNLVHYDEKMLEQARRQHFIVQNMEKALEGHQFKAYFQPKHSLHTDQTGGAEVLVRWIHPELGFMNPGEFIPLFEENGFVTRMDYYIWEEACVALRRWKEEGMPVIPLSVNMSRRDFEEPDIVAKIVALADKYGLEHELLHIEVTESSIASDPEKLAGIVAALHNAGFIIELDDFGSGYSSIATLNELTLDVLKLDMSLVRKDDPASDNSVLKFAVMLGKMLGLKLVAEGVESVDQVERLREMGCDYIQGYYYSRPLPQAEFEAYLRKEAGK
ncbi:MAG: EAL domain-containing protein [Acidaminococcaceae bacterium]|nr:EAL domain-containing protein [Acidaminococcaceae bacterium]